MSRPFNYTPRSPEQWKKREKGNTFEGFIKDEFQGFSAKKENWIRFLPPTWENASHYGIDIWVHYSVGPENASVLCLYKMTGKPCPICEAHAKAESEGREDADKLRPTRRVLVWLINRNDTKEKKPQYWAQPQTVDKEITKICRDRVTGQLYYIDHPDQGFDVTFDKDGEGMTTKYTGFQIVRQPSSIEDIYLEYAISNPLPDILLWRTYEEVKDLFEGLAGPVAPVNPVSAPAPSIPTAQAVIPTPPPPPPQVATPAPPPQFCSFETEYTGNIFGCNGQPGHGGEHNYQRFLRAAPSAPPPPPPPTAVPVSTIPSVSDRAAGLRDRFKTGPR